MHLGVVASIMVIPLVVIYAIPPGDTARLVLARTLGVVAVVVFGWGLQQFPPAARAVWTCLWLYEAVTVLADILYDVLTTVNGTPPFPGFTDLLYLSTYVFAFEGLRRLIHLLSPGRDRESWVDAAIIALAAASVVLTFVIGPLLLATDRFDLTAVVSVAYPLLDIVILATLARVLVVPRISNPSLTLLAASMSVFLGYDLAYNYLAVLDDWTEYRWLEVAWTGAILLLALASRAPGASRFRAQSTDAADRITPGRALGVGVAVLIGPTLLLFAVWTDDLLVAKWLAPGGLVVVGLLVWRMYRLLRTVQGQAQQLSGLARTDALTGVPNRRSWDFELDRAVHSGTESQARFTLALFDIDHFKTFNDNFGHQIGDTLLTSCAQAWTELLPAGATLARYGGEEFALLLPATALKDSRPLLERLREATPAEVTVSIGAAEWWPGDEVAETVGRADAAMYAAKRAGRNRVQLDASPAA